MKRILVAPDVHGRFFRIEHVKKYLDTFGRGDFW